ncbi:hypothetical protein [Erythrobacter aureus]|uniref:Uncharacterized protein n=1 Tax=Erythrobacter aureus TaxID=2182384 RepID=A0A345YJL8_9SPHN|nr:hypothetical protein [Erythrobacter aureus]AXK44120.1 hypothetical protein DVR09_16845 [Erythrobacter aureus]
MVAWFLIAIATLIVFAFIAVSSVQTLAMASDAGGRIETVKRLETVASAMIARAASPGNDGVIYLPVGEDNPSGNGYGLPSNLGFQTQTAFGQRFVYCPFGDAGGSGTSLSIPNADGTSYSVATATFEGRSYVVGGRPAYPGLTGQPNLIGFVMAPRSKLSAIPSCSDVVYNSTSRMFEASDAIVRPLTRENGIDESRTIDARQITYYVSPTGTGTGASEADPASLATALNFYRSRLPSFMTINMASGNYGMGASDLNLSGNDTLTGSTLQIRGVANSTFIDMASSGTISLPGDLNIIDVIFDADVMIAVKPNLRFSMHGSSAGRVVAAGEVRLTGNNSLTFGDDGYTFILNPGGQAMIEGTLSLITPYGKGFYVHQAGKVNGNQARVIFSTGNGNRYTRGIYLSDGEVGLNGSNLEYPDGAVFGVYARSGKIGFTQVNMAFAGAQTTQAIFAYQGTSVIVQSSIVGSGTPPLVGVQAVGATVVSGRSTSIYATSDCWAGRMFDQSAPGLTGDNSAVLDPIAVPSLSASPTGAEIEANSDAKALNAERAAAGLTNTTDWMCNA